MYIKVPHLNVIFDQIRLTVAQTTIWSGVAIPLLDSAVVMVMIWKKLYCDELNLKICS